MDQPVRLRVLRSTEDRSVNFVKESLAGFLEARYVRRPGAPYFIAYLSSQTGCNRGCAFCHLTATGQTDFIDSTQNDFLQQTLEVLDEYRREVRPPVRGWPLVNPARYMHYNFMARGEPLANHTILDEGHELLSVLGEAARNEGLPAKFNVSTIMPATLRKPLMEVFPVITPTIYYSLYSANNAWRKQWMPGAMPHQDALRMLKEYQDFSKKTVRIHHALIAGENDSPEDAWAVANAIQDAGLRVDVNIVRYNPASPAQGTEGDVEGYVSILRGALYETDARVKVIDRVGFDVKASCGMFVGG